MAGPGPGTPGRGRAAMADAIVPPGSSAILVGVSAYEYAELPPIRAARNSLQAMRSMLADPELCGWPRGQLRVIANPLSAEELKRRDRRGGRGHHRRSAALLRRARRAVGRRRAVPERDRHPSGPARDQRPALAGPGRHAARQPGAHPAVHPGLLLRRPGRPQPDPNRSRRSPAATRWRPPAGTSLPPSRSRDGQDAACTSFTAELRDLVAAGLPGRAPWLTFGDLYPALRERLLAKDLPAPSEQGSGAAREFAFTANAALPGRSRSRIAAVSLGVRTAPPPAGLPPARLPSVGRSDCVGQAAAPAALEVAPAVAAVPAPVAPVRPDVDRAQVDRLVSEALRVA